MSDLIWRDKELMLLLSDGVKNSVDTIALEVVAEAENNIQRNGQIDTGFMLNSGYVVGQKVNSYAPRQIGKKIALSAKPAPENGAVAGFAAEYALINETKNPFLWPALETTAGKSPGIMAREIPLND